MYVCLGEKRPDKLEAPSGLLYIMTYNSFCIYMIPFKLKKFNMDIATVFRKICDTLKFNDEYSKIEYNLPDCKAGGRNKKTIQNINFVLKPTITSIKLKTPVIYLSMLLKSVLNLILFVPRNSCMNMGLTMTRWLYCMRKLYMQQLLLKLPQYWTT